MSSNELAPFVAACLRDRITTDLSEENQKLQNENRELKRKLHERNPRRSIQLVLKTPDGETPIVCSGRSSSSSMSRHHVSQESVLDLRTASASMDTYFPLLNNFPVVEGQPVSLMAFPMLSIPNLELWIDGGLAERFREDLDFFYQHYLYQPLSAGGSSYDYVMYITAKKEEAGLELTLMVQSITPQEHGQLLQREETPVDFTPPPDNPDSGCMVIDVSNGEGGTPISLDRLVHLFGGGGKVVMAPLDLWKCTGTYILDHLQVPYVRAEDVAVAGN